VAQGNWLASLRGRLGSTPVIVVPRMWHDAIGSELVAVSLPDSDIAKTARIANAKQLSHSNGGGKSWRGTLIECQRNHQDQAARSERAS
jgi:hypothetical protein